MEVLFITHKYPPAIGGMEKQSYELIQGVSKKYRVHTIVYDNKTNILKFLFGLRSEVKKILKQNPRISLIHLNDGLMAAFAYFLKKMTDIPVIVTFHGLDLVFPSFLYQKLAINYFKKLDGVITVSQATAQECLVRGFDPRKVFVVRNGVDTDMSEIYKQSGFNSVIEKKLGISIEGKKILVSIGRCVRRKGFSWFLKKVMPRLDKDIIYVHIGPPQNHINKLKLLFKILPHRLSSMISLLFGLGMDEIDIREALEKPELQGRAFYLGKLPFDQMVQFLKHANLFVMPNIKVRGDAEGFGLVALEATINGLPVVASDLEGITCAVIEGKNGFLVKYGNPDAWIDKIHSLLQDVEALRSFGEKAQQYTIDNFSWTHMVDGYIKVFQKYHVFERQNVESMLLIDEPDYSKVAV